MIPKFYRTLQYLSIDIVIGAVTLLHFFSKPFEVSIPWPSYLTLAFAVWIIYTLDHLRDAKEAKKPLRGRYEFHAKHTRALQFWIFLVGIFSCICLLFLPTPILVLGVVLSAFCLLYLIFQSALAKVGLKECYVAAMYAFGILVSPMALANAFHSFSFFTLFILAFINLLLFSWFETHQDTNDTFMSFSTVKGREKTQKLIWVLISAGLACGISGLWEVTLHSSYLIFVLFLFWMLLITPQWASKNQRYRTLGDGVFILPLLFELL